MKEGRKKLLIEDCQKSCTNVSRLNLFRDQTILVTGGTGFVGKWISEFVSFLNENENLGIKLILLARDIDKFKSEVPHLAVKPWIYYIKQDIRNLKDLPREINYIVHAAGTPDTRDHLSDPIRTLEIFSNGTKLLLEAASRLPDLKRIVHLSSHRVYGELEFAEGREDSIRENSATFKDVYAEAKKISESICNAYRQQLKLPIVIVRPFSFIGPYQSLDKPWAINNFIRDELLGGPIRILGNESTIRSYLYASDMAFWLLSSLAEGRIGECYNIGNPEGIELIELASVIRQAGANNVDIINKSSKDDYNYTSKSIPNIDKLIDDLGVRMNFQLEEAIGRTILFNKI